MPSHSVMRGARVVAAAATLATLSLVQMPARAQSGARANAPAPNYDLAAQWTSQKVGEAGVRHDGDAALARERRPVLVRLPDARRPASSTSSIR